MILDQSYELKFIKNEKLGMKIHRIWENCQKNHKTQWDSI
jgi:hypothetical protein